MHISYNFSLLTQIINKKQEELYSLEFFIKITPFYYEFMMKNILKVNKVYLMFVNGKRIKGSINKELREKNRELHMELGSLKAHIKDLKVNIQRGYDIEQWTTRYLAKLEVGASQFHDESNLSSPWALLWGVPSLDVQRLDALLVRLIFYAGTEWLGFRTLFSSCNFIYQVIKSFWLC